MHTLLSNYIYFVVPLIAWIVAQLAKIIIKGVCERDWNWRYIYRSGAMPSAHTTVIVSLCTLLGHRLGTQSPEFGIASILALIIMYDAINVRHAVGEHAEALRLIIPAVFQKGKRPDLTIHQSYGHTPYEVLVGVVIGVVVPIILFIFA